MTDLQVLYDSFTKKTNEGWDDRVDLFVSYIYPSIAKIYKQLRHGYTYTFDDVAQTGYFKESLDIDEIELVALQMAYDYTSDSKLSRLSSMRQMLGTKDFDKIPNLKNEMDTVTKRLEILEATIESLKNNMNDYYGHS